MAQMKSLEERIGSLEGLKKLRAINSQLEDAVRKRNEGGGAQVFEDLKVNKKTPPCELGALSGGIAGSEPVLGGRTSLRTP